MSNLLLSVIRGSQRIALNQIVQAAQDSLLRPLLTAIHYGQLNAECVNGLLSLNKAENEDFIVEHEGRIMRIRHWVGSRISLVVAKRQFRRAGLDPKFKKQFLSGTTYELQDVAKLYDEAWKVGSDNCVNSSDLNLICQELSGQKGSLLDAGCGQGLVSLRLAKEGFDVTGVDISREAIQVAAENAKRMGVKAEFLQSPLETLPFPDKSFDVVVCCHTLEHVQDVVRVAQELERVCKEKIVIIVPQEESANLLSTDYHIQFFPTVESLHAALPWSNGRCTEEFVENNQWHGRYLFYTVSI